MTTITVTFDSTPPNARSTDGIFIYLFIIRSYTGYTKKEKIKIKKYKKYKKNKNNKFKK